MLVWKESKILVELTTEKVIVMQLQQPRYTVTPASVGRLEIHFSANALISSIAGPRKLRKFMED